MGSPPELRLLQGGADEPAPPPPPAPFMERAEGFRAPLVFILVVTTIRLIIASKPGLVADEAYYWTWSRELAAGYYDHPPMIAWIIRLSTEIFGKSELGVRALPIVLSGVAAGLLVASARRPWITAAALSSIPLFVIGGLLATPDIPLVFGWSLALFGLIRGGRWWLIAGLGAGIAVLGKLTGLLLLPLLLMARPAELRTKWPWLGAGLALIVMLPNIIWLASHDWVTLTFQAGHGLASGSTGGFMSMLELLLGQFLLITPLLFIPAVAFWIVAWREKGIVRALWWLSAPPFLFFLVASYFSRSEPNWLAPVYLAASLGLGHMSFRWRRITWVGIGLSGALSLLLLVHLWYPVFKIKKDPSFEIWCGELLADSVEAWGISPVYTARYQEAAWIEYYGGIEAETLPLVDSDTRRLSQYDLWPRAELKDAVFVREWRRSPPSRLASYWDDWIGPNTVIARDPLERLAGRWQVYEVFLKEER